MSDTKRTIAEDVWTGRRIATYLYSTDFPDAAEVVTRLADIAERHEEAVNLLREQGYSKDWAERRDAILAKETDHD